VRPHKRSDVGDLSRRVMFYKYLDNMFSMNNQILQCAHHGLSFESAATAKRKLVKRYFKPNWYPVTNFNIF